MFRYTRRRSSRESPSYESAFGGAISVAIGRRLPEKGRARGGALRGRMCGGRGGVGGAGRRVRVPVRVRRAVFDDPSLEELAIRARRNALLSEKGLERGAQRRQAVERHGGEVVVLEVQVRPEIDELPERRARHPRAPFRGLAGHDVVMLPEAVEGERGREDEEHGHRIKPQEARGPAEKADRRRRQKVQADGREALTADSPLERLGIRGGLHPGGAEVDREEHGGRVKQLQPPHVPFRREVRTLRVVRGRAELGMVIEVPARELRRRDPGGKRVDEAEEAIGARSVAVEDGLVDDLVKEDRSVEDDEAEDERAWHAHPEALEMPAERERGGEEDELAEGDREMARGALLMQRPQDVVRHGSREPLPQISDRAVEVPRLHPGTGYAGRKEKALSLNSRNAPCSNRRRVWSGLLSPHFLRDEIERPALHFVVDPAEVLPEDADDRELHAAQEQDEDHERRPSGHVDLQNPESEDDEDVEKREGRDEKAEPRRELERHVAERRQSVERETQHLAQRELRLPARARRPYVLDAHLSEADPCRHAADEPVSFAQAPERRYGARAHEAEVADVHRDFHVRPALEESVENVRRPELERALAFSLRPLRVDDLVPFVDLLQHLGEELGRVLQIRVHHGHDPAACGVDARGERHLVAEVAREPERPQARVLAGEGRHLLEGRVRAAVVHVHDLPCAARGGEDAREALVQLVEVVGLVENGQRDRDLGAVHDVLPGAAAAAAEGAGEGGVAGWFAAEVRRKTVTQTAPMGLLPSARSQVSSVKT